MRSTDAGFPRAAAGDAGRACRSLMFFRNCLRIRTHPRSFFLYPGGTVPRFGVVLINRRNVEKIVRVDPMTGVPQVERAEPAEQ